MNRRLLKITGLTLVALGLLLLAGSGAYYLYSLRAEAGLQELNRQALPLQEANLSPALQRLYPGEALPAQHWGNPWAYSPPDPEEVALLQGFLPVDYATLPPPGTLAPSTRILIPAINLDSEVQGLEILDLGNSRQYETPKNVVGHIPETASPGETATGWYFGHLESPIRGEGSVFRNLPKVPSLLERGEPVYVVQESPDGKYLYQVTKTEVIPQEELQLYNVGDPSIVLVVCVPKLTYDHRLLVTATLVGIQN